MNIRPTMRKLNVDDPTVRSADEVTANIRHLHSLFPEAFIEGNIEFDTLRQLLGDTVDGRDEKYGLNWHGKRRARQIALTPSTGTLRPCPEDSVDWESTQNLMIEGDNLEVLKLLQKSYAGKVKLIYIDPPYNTGKDFVYPDNFQDSIKNYLELTGQTGEGGKKLSSNTESSGRFHTDWLNMMYPRLKLARNLLREDGLIAISIDDNEIDRLRLVLAEVFGEENFAAQICVQSNPRGRQSDTFFATVHEYLIVYARSGESCAIGGAALSEDQKAEFGLKDAEGKSYRLLGLRQRGAASLREDRPDMFFPVYVNPKTLQVSLEPAPGFTETVLPRKSTGEDGRWMWGKEKCKRDIHLLVPRMIERRSEFDVFVMDGLERDGEERSRKYKTLWDDKKLNTQNGTQEVKELLGSSAMSFPKPVALLQDVLQLGTENGDIVMDFFAGSGTTGHATMLQNAIDQSSRRYILVQLPEPVDPSNKEQKSSADYCDSLGKPRTIAELTKERLRRAANEVAEDTPMFKGDLGFRVFKLASSSIQSWEPDRGNIAESLEASIEHLKSDRTEQDILFELLLKLGLDLCVPIESRTFVGAGALVHTVRSVGGGSLIVCLSKLIPQADVESLAIGIVKWYETLGLAGECTVVFRDSAFADDVTKSNLVAILQQHGLGHVRSL